MPAAIPPRPYRRNERVTPDSPVAAADYRRFATQRVPIVAPRDTTSHALTAFLYNSRRRLRLRAVTEQAAADHDLVLDRLDPGYRGARSPSSCRPRPASGASRSTEHGKLARARELLGLLRHGIPDRAAGADDRRPPVREERTARNAQRVSVDRPAVRVEHPAEHRPRRRAGRVRDPLEGRPARLRPLRGTRSCSSWFQVQARPAVGRSSTYYTFKRARAPTR